MSDHLLIVELVEPVPAAHAASVAKQASLHLGISEERVRKLLAARVGPITHALRPEKAELIAEAFEAAGARVVVRLADPEERSGEEQRHRSTASDASARNQDFGSPSGWGVGDAPDPWTRASERGLPSDRSPAPASVEADRHEGFYHDEDGVDDRFDALASHPVDASGAATGASGATGQPWQPAGLEEEKLEADLWVGIGAAEPPTLEAYDRSNVALPGEEWAAAAAPDVEPVDTTVEGAGDADEFDGARESAAASPRHVPPPMPWVPRAERSKSEGLSPLSSAAAFGDSDFGDDDFDFSSQRPTRLARPDADEAEVYRAIWDDPAARQRRRTFLAALLLVGIFVLIGLQYYQAQGGGSLPPPNAGGLGGGQGSTIEVLPPGR